MVMTRNEVESYGHLCISFIDREKFTMMGPPTSLPCLSLVDSISSFNPIPSRSHLTFGGFQKKIMFFLLYGSYLIH